MPKLITTEVTVVRRNHRDGCEERTEQELTKTVRVMGIPVFRRVLDCEVVPEFALIEAGCLGGTTWRSRFADTIDAQRQRQRESVK